VTVRKGPQLRRLSRIAVAATALLCVFTIGAGVAVARLLPQRIALWRPARIAAAPLTSGSGQVVNAATGRISSPGITMSGLSEALSPVLGSGALGPKVGALVTDLSTGQVLYSLNASTGYTPASTTKLATSVAALKVLGANARFKTTVVTGRSNGSIVLVGGGDPTLAAGRPPPADYPQPATLQALARQTASALRARGEHSVRLGYDTSLYTGPGFGPGWSADDASTGNVTVITPLEVDQGRLTPAGRPEDADDAGNFRPRSTDPSGQAADAFAAFLRADGVGVRGVPAQLTARAGATTLASVRSPLLSQVIQWMLVESNNVIAENLARHIALATGAQPSFTGAAAAEMSVLRRLGVTGVQLNDGSGLSHDNRITPAALVQLIGLAGRRTALRSVLTGLPVYGFSGTLADAPGSIFYGSAGPALGTVRAKTGNLETVIALAGVAYASDGQLLSFAVMADKLKSLPAAGGSLAGVANVLAGCGCR
jgi:D-alanyl-D-alanine carboxypeptidase/D-alanyl-D-alanine-endopeptidase (penicillin-binding protein 4)